MSTTKQQRQFRRRSVVAVAVSLLSAAAVVGIGLAALGMPARDEAATLPGSTTSAPTTTVAPPATTTPTSGETLPPTTAPPTTAAPTTPPTTLPATTNNDADVGVPDGFTPPPPPAEVVPIDPPLALPELGYVGWFETPYIEGFTARQWHYEANGLPNDVVCAALERDIAARGYEVTTRLCSPTVYFEFRAGGWQGFATRSSPGSLRDLVYVEARQL